MKQLYLTRRLKYKLGIYKKRKTKTRLLNSTTTYLLIFTMIFTFMLYRCSARLCDFAILTGKDQLKNDIMNNCSRITSSLLSDFELTYDSMVTAQSGDNGKINSISTDFYKINLLKTSFEQNLTEYLSSHNRIICKIPFGAILFDDIFIAWGPNIPTVLLTSSVVSVDFFDDFTSAGINQTKHTLILKVIVNSKIHTLFKSTDTEIKLDIPVAETIIVDDVPNYVFPSPATE